MQNLDLNIDNYSLEDILNLFNLPYDFTEFDLKEAKKIVLKTHPDKSKLESTFFLFFTKAYKYLYFIYEFRQRNSKTKRDNLDKEENHYEIIKNIKEKKDFHKLFNKLFEENMVSDDYRDNGYDDWLKNYQNTSNQPKINNLSDMTQAFMKEKREKMELISYKGVEEYEDTSQFYLTRDKPENYSSSLFSKLQFEDVKKAHSENVIPVSEHDFDQSKHFNNVTQLQMFRSNQNVTPLLEDQANKYMEDKKKLESRENTNRAFKLAKQMEEVERINENIISKFKYLQ